MSGKHPEPDRAALDRLKAVHAQLQSVHAGIVVVTAALRRQGADQDEEVALVLQSLIGDRLARQIEQIGDIIESRRSRWRVRERMPATSWGAWRHGADPCAGAGTLEWMWQCEDVRFGYAPAAGGEDAYIRWTVSPGGEHAFAAWQSSPRNRLSVRC